MILGILICGILFTSFTVRLVGKQTAEQEWENNAAYAPVSGGEQGRSYPGAELPQAAAAGAEEIPQEAETDENEGGQEETEAAEGETVLPDAAVYGDAAAAEDTQEERVEQQNQETAAAAMARSPVSMEEASMEADEHAGPGVMLEEDVGGTVLSGEKKTAEDFRRRLEEIDSQIADQRSRNEASTTYDMWTLAENERKLWDSELNNIYTNIRSHIPEDQQEALVREERAWIVSRDAKAAEDAEKYAGGTLESVEYTASLAASTRDRAYELVETYGEYLR